MLGSNARAFEDFTNKVKGFSQVLRQGLSERPQGLCLVYCNNLRYCLMKDQGFNHQLLIFKYFRPDALSEVEVQLPMGPKRHIAFESIDTNLMVSARLTDIWILSSN